MPLTCAVALCFFFLSLFKVEMWELFSLFIQNAYECQCCTEIEELAHALNHEDVISETRQLPNCITAHPKFLASLP